MLDELPTRLRKSVPPLPLPLPSDDVAVTVDEAELTGACAASIVPVLDGAVFSKSK
jgi:hypothetical protein